MTDYDDPGLIASTMSLRDHIAIEAMKSWISGGAMQRIMEHQPDPSIARQMLSHGCYEMADSMLKERSK